MLQPDFADDAPAIALGGGRDGVLAGGETDGQQKNARHFSEALSELHVDSDVPFLVP